MLMVYKDLLPTWMRQQRRVDAFSPPDNNLDKMSLGGSAILSIMRKVTRSLNRDLYSQVSGASGTETYFRSLVWIELALN